MAEKYHDLPKYHDIPNGCSKYHDCFTCPLPDCRVVESEMNRGNRPARKERERAVLEMWKQGKTYTKICEEVGYNSTASVWAIIDKFRKKGQVLTTKLE